MDILVGHNIAFDIMYLIKSNPQWIEWLKTGRIWDTMIAEYMLSGQEKIMPSLDHCSKKYGGTLKDSTVKQYWEDGVDTESIPDSEIEPYLIADVENTELVFLSQVEQAVSSNMLQLIWDIMDSRIATVMMEYDGDYFNKEKAASERDALLEGVLLNEQRLQKLFEKKLGPNAFKHNKFTYSQKYLHPILFGGTVDYPTRQQDGVIKTGPNKGKPKMKKVMVKVVLTRVVDPLAIPQLSKGKNGMYSLDETSLKSILAYFNRLSAIRPYSMDIKIILELILLIRESKKRAEMYTTFINHTWPGNFLHPKFNHARTETGRLSCADPNVQQA